VDEVTRYRHRVPEKRRAPHRYRETPLGAHKPGVSGCVIRTIHVGLDSWTASFTGRSLTDEDNMRPSAWRACGHRRLWTCSAAWRSTCRPWITLAAEITAISRWRWS